MKDRRFIPYRLERIQSLEGVKLASFKQRALAFIIDILICLLIILGILLFAGFIIWLNYFNISEATYTLRFDMLTWYVNLIVNLSIPVLYFGLSTYFTNGKTIGKKLLRIRVVSLVSEKIGFWNALERPLGYGASLFDLFIGFLKYYINANCMTSHDCIANTIVITD